MRRAKKPAERELLRHGIDTKVIPLRGYGELKCSQNLDESKEEIDKW